MLIPCRTYRRRGGEHASAVWYVGTCEGGMFLCNQCLAEYLYFLIGIPPMECLRRRIDCIETWGI